MINANLNVSPQKIYERVANFTKLPSDKQDKYANALLSPNGNKLINTIDPITHENALHLAIKKGNKTTAFLLIALKIDKNQINKNGKKPYELEDELKLAKLAHCSDIFAPLPSSNVGGLKSSTRAVDNHKKCRYFID